MYIRSQKGFLLCNAAAIASIKTDKSKITNTIFAEMVDGCKIPLGFYDSYDRCKEIMHSIHNRQKRNNVEHKSTADSVNIGAAQKDFVLQHLEDVASFQVDSTNTIWAIMIDSSCTSFGIFKSADQCRKVLDDIEHVVGDVFHMPPNQENNI